MPRRIAILLAISCACAATLAATRAALACSCGDGITLLSPPVADGQLVAVDAGFTLQQEVGPYALDFAELRLRDPSGADVPVDIQVFQDAGYCGAKFAIIVPKEPLSPNASYTFEAVTTRPSLSLYGLPLTFTTEAVSAVTPTALTLNAEYTYRTAKTDPCDYFHGGLVALISGDVVSDSPGDWLVVARNLDAAPDAVASVRAVRRQWPGPFYLELPLLDPTTQVEVAVYNPRGVQVLSKQWLKPDRCADGCQRPVVEIPCTQAVGAGPVDATNGGNGVDGATYCGPTAEKWTTPAATSSKAGGCGSTPASPAPLAPWLLAALAFIAAWPRRP